MNFLAHCYIGDRAGGQGHDASLLVGGFLGDFIKGPIPDEMPEALARGVRLHRRIDAYSNQHPDIRASSRRFPAELRRIAPVLVDIICDHLLVRRWHEFHPGSLQGFTADTYAEVARHGAWLPASGHRFLSYARDRDLFALYGDWEVTSGAMRSITRRLDRSELDIHIEQAVPSILEELESDFSRYFPDILRHARDWVRTDCRG